MEPDRDVGGVTRQCDTGAILESLELNGFWDRPRVPNHLCEASGDVGDHRVHCPSHPGNRLYALQPFKESHLVAAGLFRRGVDPSCSEAKMEGFQRIAAAWVETCTLR